MVHDTQWSVGGDVVHGTQWSVGGGVVHGTQWSVGGVWYMVLSGQLEGTYLVHVRTSKVTQNQYLLSEVRTSYVCCTCYHR